MFRKGAGVGISQIVTIIIGLVMFIGGMSLFYTLFTGGVDTFCQIDSQMEDELLNRNNDGSEVFTFPDRVEVGASSPFCDSSQADFIYHVGINNNRGDDTEFGLSMEMINDTADDRINMTSLGFSGNLSQGESAIAIIAGNIDGELERGQYTALVNVSYDGNEHGRDTVRIRVP